MTLTITSTPSAFYPLFGVNKLRSKQGKRWAELVDWLSTLDADAPEVMALTLTLRRLSRVQNLSQTVCRDPFCALCAASVVESIEGGEEALLAAYRANLMEITHTIATMPVRHLRERVHFAAA
jgi:hypothetical protein